MLLESRNHSRDMQLALDFMGGIRPKPTPKT